MSCNLLIVEPSLVLLKPPTLGGVFPRCGSLHLNFSDLYLDEIANGDETDQPVSQPQAFGDTGASSFLTSAGGRIGLQRVTQSWS